MGYGSKGNDSPDREIDQSHTGLTLTLNAVKEKTKTLFTLTLYDPALKCTN